MTERHSTMTGTITCEGTVEEPHPRRTVGHVWLNDAEMTRFSVFDYDVITAEPIEDIPGGGWKYRFRCERCGQNVVVGRKRMDSQFGVNLLGHRTTLTVLAAKLNEA